MNEHAVASGAKVLLVDDDSDVRKMLATLLQLEGYEVLEARDGMEALRIFSKIRPDLIVLDLGMPRLNGFEVLDRFRAMTGFDDEVPVVILSAFSDDERIEEGYKRGATIYITKPAQIPEFLTFVSRLTGESTLR